MKAVKKASVKCINDDFFPYLLSASESAEMKYIAVKVKKGRSKTFLAITANSVSYPFNIIRLPVKKMAPVRAKKIKVILVNVLTDSKR
jgi:hypothetical protein